MYPWAVTLAQFIDTDLAPVSNYKCPEIIKSQTKVSTPLSIHHYVIVIWWFAKGSLFKNVRMLVILIYCMWLWIVLCRFALEKNKYISLVILSCFSVYICMCFMLTQICVMAWVLLCEGDLRTLPVSPLFRRLKKKKFVGFFVLFYF